MLAAVLPPWAASRFSPGRRRYRKHSKRKNLAYKLRKKNKGGKIHTFNVKKKLMLVELAGTRRGWSGPGVWLICFF